MARYNYRKIYIWNAQIAYFSGLIASDGCMLNDGRHIDITSKDTEIIKNAQSIISTNAVPSVKKSGYSTFAYRLQIGDLALYDFLLKAGVTPVKSKTIKSVAVPDVYYVDFLRGLFDGDGSTYGYKDIYWSCHKYYVTFASASQEFLTWLYVTNKRLFMSVNGTIKLGTRVYSLVYGKADSQALFTAMYYPEHTHRLTRKYDKLKEFITADPYAKITVNARVAEW